MSGVTNYQIFSIDQLNIEIILLYVFLSEKEGIGREGESVWQSDFME